MARLGRFANRAAQIFSDVAGMLPPPAEPTLCGDAGGATAVSAAAYAQIRGC